ncbi:MAG: TonB-dependent receptor [Draconibacterium sp.]
MKKKSEALGGFYPVAQKLLLIMRLSVFLVLISVFASTASVYSQATKLTVKMKNCKIADVFDAIEQQSDFYFFYNRDNFNDNRVVSVNMEGKTVEKILDELFEGRDVSYEIINKNILIKARGKSTSAFNAQQQKTVNGTVTDNTGQPLPGVTVIIKGTAQGTVTDMDGKYSLGNIPEDAVLVFSFVGMLSQEIKVGNQATIDVVMKEEALGIDEVVVVGYGTQKKSHLTAAVDQIGGEILENRPLSSVADGLQGIVAGLNVRAPNGAPEASLNLNIRGFTGFGTTESPLVLVDGIERNIDDINPNDVESISVLKDGAASAIYGSRAPFGVVLITTKGGKKGSPLHIKYSGNFRFGKPWGIPEIQNSADFARSINRAFYNAPGGNGSAFFSDLQIQRMEAFAKGDFTNSVFDGIDPEYVPYGVFPESATQWAGHTNAFGNTNWLDLALKDVVPSQEHNVSVSGGSDKTAYYMGLGYNENVGIFEGPNYKKRYSSLMKVDTEITEWLTVEASANYVKTDEEGPNFQGLGRNYSSLFDAFARSYPVWVTTNPNGSAYRFNTLPNINGDAGTVNRYRNDLTMTGGVTIEPIKNLVFEGDFTWRNNNDEWSSTALQTMQVLPNGNEVPNQRTVGTTYIEKYFSRTNYSNIDLHASYSKTLMEKHNLFGLIGFQQEENQFSRLNGRANNLLSTSLTTISTASSDYYTSDALTHWATRGYFGRLSYNYDTKYFFEFNFRRDATSRFLADDRWGFFPSVSGAWNIAREKFWMLSEQVSMFKLRGSWSTSGNADVGSLYPFYPTINITQSEGIILDGGFVNVASMPGLVSSQLTWAKPTTIDFGGDISAFKNRLEVNYDWYQRTVKNQFGPPKPLPETLGATVPNSNNATSETRGWELKLNWRDKAFNLANSPFHYSVNFRISDYVGYVMDYEDNGTGAVSGQWTPGEVFGQNYLYASNGIMTSVNALYGNVPQGDTWYYLGDLARKDMNGDGEINGGTTGTWYSRGDLIKDGFNYPRKTYGIGLSADWKGFDVSLQMDGVGSWTVYSTNQYVWGNSGSQWFAPYFVEQEALGYWSLNNTGAFFPRDTYNAKNRNANTDQYALDLSHLRIRNLKIGYNFPKQLVKKVKLNKLYLYASAENLGFIYYNSYIKYDPELLGAAGGQGYPPQQVMSFGVNVEF